MFDEINFNGPDYLSANAALCQVYLPDFFFHQPDAFKFCITHGKGALVYEFLDMVMFQRLSSKPCGGRPMRNSITTGLRSSTDVMKPIRALDC